MEKLAVIWIFSALVGNSLEDDITASSAEVFSSEGQTATVSCSYSVKADNLQWYRQDPGSAPQFLLLITNTKEPSVVEAKPPNPRLSATLNEERNRVNLQISSAAVTDSAVYYCALTATSQSKIFFGSGITLTVESRTKYEPAYFKVGEGNNSACLATGFSRHNATTKHEKYGEEFKKTKAVAISPNLDLYNQVIFLKDDGSGCGGGGAKTCTDTLVPDEKVNLMSLTILGLRVIFIKTIIFNILLTLRLWISQ